MFQGFRGLGVEGFRGLGVWGLRGLGVWGLRGLGVWGLGSGTLLPSLFFCGGFLVLNRALIIQAGFGAFGLEAPETEI